jgi:protease II
MVIEKNQLLRAIERGKQEGKEFIKWWRKENDFADFELIDHYLEATGARHNVENYQLLDKDEMWEVLKRWNPNVRHSVSTKSDTIEWQHRGNDGKMHTYTCPYNAHSMMSIFDAETRGNPLV